MRSGYGVGRSVIVAAMTHRNWQMDETIVDDWWASDQRFVMILDRLVSYLSSGYQPRHSLPLACAFRFGGSMIFRMLAGWVLQSSHTSAESR